MGAGGQWLVTGWMEVSRLSVPITKWVVLPLWAARQPFQKIYVFEGHKGSQKVVKSKPGVELWFTVRPNSLRALWERPIKWDAFPWPWARWQPRWLTQWLSSEALCFCLSAFFSLLSKELSFHVKERKLYSPGPNGQIMSISGRDPSSHLLPWGPQILGGLFQVL